MQAIGISNLSDEDAAGNTVPLTEIDGFTFFRYLNRYGKAKRLQLLQALCTKWNISPLPEDVDGLPEISALNVWLFPAKAQRTKGEIQTLWTFFKAVLNDTLTDELFTETLAINGTRKVKLTEAIYLLRPDTYLCLNRTVKSYLQSAHLPTEFSSLSTYLTVIQKAKEVFSKSFPEIVKAAYEFVPHSFADTVAEEEIIYHSAKPKETASEPLNILLYGPPGTGKTYTAIDKALLITDVSFYKENQQNRSAITQRFQELTVQDYNHPQGQIAFCTFHQSMSYEDFVEGIKPGMGEDSAHLQYGIQDGIFKVMTRMAQQALEQKTGLNYVLIIDEINRGNISAIFGELITLIEDNKRTGQDEALIVTLPYSKKPFSVPPNLYIVGTMNTADRSVESLDTALRRRFVFEEVVPQPQLLSPQQLISRLYARYADVSWNDETFRKAADALYSLLGIDPAFEYVIRDKNDDADADKVMALSETLFKCVNLEKLLIAINKRLAVLLSADHTIGHAWLMEVYSLADLQSVFKHKIIPLLQEYFFNNYAKIGLVLGNAFVKQEPVHKGVFATFTDVTEMASDYTDKIKYILVDASTLSIKAFCSIYQ